MVLSAGIGYVELNERLSRVTEHRMVDSGISCDLVRASHTDLLQNLLQMALICRLLIVPGLRVAATLASRPSLP